MIELLDKFIGPNAATYLGTFLAIIALFFGGKKLLKSNKQNQKVKGGNGIQIGGNFSINVNKDSEK